MIRRRLSGTVLIASVLVIALGGIFFTPPGLYQETDINLRMQIVDEHQSQFTISQVMSILAATGMTLGYLILTLQLQRDGQARWANLGAAAMILATISLATYVLLTLADPRTYLDRALRESSGLSFIVDLFAWLTIAGYLLYGIVFLRGDFPKWLAYATLGITALVLVAVLFVETFAVEVLFVMPLIVGIALLRRMKKPERALSKV